MVTPVVTPLTIPPVVTVAIAVFALLQAPVIDVSESVVVAPTHTPEAPEIGLPATGEGLTVTLLVVVAEVPQLVESVYEIVTVPELTPVTIPVAVTVATEVLLLRHVPPLAVSLSVTVEPVQTGAVEPVITPALAVPLTVTDLEAELEPQLLV